METESKQTKQSQSEPKPPSLRSLKAKRDELNEEYRFLAPEAIAGSGAAQGRRFEIAQELRGLVERIFAREPDVEVTIPRSATGHPFRLGDASYHPGKYTVKASVAQYLMWMVDRNREDEIKRLQANGTTVALKDIGDYAHQTERGI